MFYAPSEAYGTDPITPPFPSTITVFPNATGFALNQQGSMTITQTGPQAGLLVPVQYSKTTGLGSYGWSDNTAADTTGTEPLKLGSAGGLATLNFNDGGFDGDTGIQYFVNIFLPGDWSKSGTATGDHQFISVAPGFSTPTFIYDPVTKMTTVFTENPDYMGNPVALDFTLYGGPTGVPEPSTWAMMIAGFAGLGFLGWRRTPKVRAAA
jgi:hypothetical protein